MDGLNELDEMLERIEAAPKQPLVRQIMQLLDGLTRQEISDILSEVGQELHKFFVGFPYVYRDFNEDSEPQTE